MTATRILDVTDESAFGLVPPCSDPGFDHRTCDFWEDEKRGSKAARLAWLEAPPAPSPAPVRAFNPFAPAEKGGAFLDLLRQEKDLNWTFLSPSALFVPGERTGKFRLGTDQLLTAADGKSSISFEDFAVALADEIERPAHIRKRFTVGY